MKRDFRGFLPICQNQVAPWFDSLPEGFSDATSFRHMIAMAEEDRAGLDALRESMAVAGCGDDAAADIKAADELIADMRARLAMIARAEGR
jgi:hypothetical protein